MIISPRYVLTLAWFSTSLFLSSSLEAAPKRPIPQAEGEAYEDDEFDDYEDDFEDAEGYEERAREPERRAEQPRNEPKKTWLSLGIAGDIAWASGKNVCVLESQRDNGYTCFREAKSGKLEQYFGEPVLGEGNALAPGFRLRTGRVLLGLDQVVGESFTAGARLGFAFNGGPKGETDARGFLPLHLEGRFAYWFGDDPFAKVGFRPYVFAGGGLAQVDIRTRVSVVEDSRPTHQPDNPEEQILVVYKKMGQGFVGLGGGVIYALSETSGIVLEVKGMMMFPSSGQVLQPTVGYAIGL